MKIMIPCQVMLSVGRPQVGEASQAALTLAVAQSQVVPPVQGHPRAVSQDLHTVSMQVQAPVFTAQVLRVNLTMQNQLQTARIKRRARNLHQLKNPK